MNFMWFIVFWNHAEMIAKQIAQCLLGETPMSMAITAEIGNQTLMDAIQVASHELTRREMGPLAEHLQHFCKGYRILKGHRNFYVHGAFATTPANEGSHEPVLKLHSIDGKGRVRFFNESLTSADIATTIASIHDLIAYGTAIQTELGATGYGIESLQSAYQASLEKPEWPSAIQKTPLYLQGQEPPLQQPKRGAPKK